MYDRPAETSTVENTRKSMKIAFIPNLCHGHDNKMITINPKCTHTIMSFLKHLSDDRHCKKVACHSEVQEVQKQE